MSVPAHRRDPWQELLDLPPQMVGEIVRGELWASPRPAGKHALVSSDLGADLIARFRRGQGGPGGWWILDEPELHLGSSVLVPDLAGWRRERLANPAEHTSFTLPPDWVCEVESPSTRRLDRGLKLQTYAEHGIPWCWLIDPDAELVQVYELVQGRWQLATTAVADDVVRLPPFDAVALELCWWWGREPQPAEPG